MRRWPKVSHTHWKSWNCRMGSSWKKNKSSLWACFSFFFITLFFFFLLLFITWKLIDFSFFSTDLSSYLTCPSYFFSHNKIIIYHPKYSLSFVLWIKCECSAENFKLSKYGLLGKFQFWKWKSSACSLSDFLRFCLFFFKIVDSQKHFLVYLFHNA